MKQILLIALFPIYCFSDMVPYMDSLHLYDSTSNHIVHHFHDWKKHNGFIELKNKDGIQLFKVTSGAFTFIKLFDDDSIIILLSEILIDNRVHFAVYDYSGHLLFKTKVNDSNSNFNEYGIHATVTNFIYWYDSKQPMIKLNDNGKYNNIGIKTPNNKFIYFDVCKTFKCTKQ